MEINSYISEVKNNLDKINKEEIEKVIALIYKACISNKTVFIIGNGGSASNASHLAQDLSRVSIYYQKKEKRIKTISLTDNVSFITAVANDFGFENIFTSQLRTFTNDGDVLIAISCSGNSKNVVAAVNYAHKQKMAVIGITGFDGGKLKKQSKINIHIPVNDFGLVESIHSTIFHYIAIELRNKFTRH
ncbi:MAG: SIS domain-containing protein [Bacteroidales bacterium]|jgi:D-sedoheptulose 7-phosphate isomerase|nr:SIS domain-containing protein [Bacteroidales bacterium]